jgi:hypothetical protein
MRIFTSTSVKLVLVGAVLSSVLALSGWLLLERSGSAGAQPPPIIGFDMNTTGNSCPGGGAAYPRCN